MRFTYLHTKTNLGDKIMRKFKKNLDAINQIN